MATKLTLVLNKDIIKRAKLYAASKNTSLSKLIETYLDRITAGDKLTEEISPLVESLSGVLTLPENIDLKKDYADHLENKYLHD